MACHVSGRCFKDRAPIKWGNWPTLVLNCRGGGHFAKFGKKSPPYHFIKTPPQFYEYFPKKSEKVPKPSFSYGFWENPPDFPRSTHPLELSTKEYLRNPAHPQPKTNLTLKNGFGFVMIEGLTQWTHQSVKELSS